MNIFIFKDKNNTSAGYVQITEDELQAYKKNSEGKVFLINLGHSIMEVDEIAYHDFYKEENREDYRKKLVRITGRNSLSKTMLFLWRALFLANLTNVILL